MFTFLSMSTLMLPSMPIDVVPDGVADGEAGAPGKAARNRAADDVARRRRKVIRRIVGIVPGAVDHRRLVIGHVDGLRRRRLDDDHLLVVGFLGDRDLLLFGRCELAVRLRLWSRRRWIASITSGCCASTASPSFCVQSRSSLIMASTVGVATSAFTLASQSCLVERLVELVALERFVRLGEAVGLHHLERIGRGHQHLREQGVGIERDRRDQRVELALAEGLLLGCGGFGALPPDRPPQAPAKKEAPRWLRLRELRRIAWKNGLRPAISSHQGCHDWP